LEVLRLRAEQAAGTLPPALTVSIAESLRQLARDLLVRAPRESWKTGIAAMRKDAADIAAAGGAEALRIAASLRVIAAAVEDYPDFFRK
ncbi:hypothetical protein, partial [Serratia marcescens]